MNKLKSLFESFLKTKNDEFRLISKNPWCYRIQTSIKHENNEFVDLSLEINEDFRGISLKISDDSRTVDYIEECRGSLSSKDLETIELYTTKNALALYIDEIFDRIPLSEEIIKTNSAMIFSAIRKVAESSVSMTNEKFRAELF